MKSFTSDLSVGTDTFRVMPSTFLLDHRTRLAQFQSGEDRFVWGRRKDNDDLWFLEENTATEHRSFVKELVVCPVPGCAAPLTTAHYKNKRDHLRHLSSTGGHGRESILHSQGCALIESWLAREYPGSRVKREEYTNQRGERRADVLLTGKRGDRVAFEIQYSPLTPDDWQRRHDSYVAQGIRDVWLFGHTGKQLKMDKDGYVRPNPTHRAVVASGSALLFINPDPEQQQIAVAVGGDRLFDAATDRYRPEPVEVLHQLDRAQLQIYNLTEFKADLRWGFTSEALTGLYERSEGLRSQNAAALEAVVQRKERERREQQARLQAQKVIRAPQLADIRLLLGGVERWSKSEAHAAIVEYFGDRLNGRIDLNSSPSAPPGLLVRWQCVLYFEMVAGQDKLFTTRDAYHAVLRSGVKLDQEKGFRDTYRYLTRLCPLGVLRERPGYGRFPSYQATSVGAWW